MNTENQSPPSESPGEPQPPISLQPRLPVWWFLAALFAPPVLTFLSALARLGDAAIPIALLGSGMGGLACGVLLGRRVGGSTSTRVAFGILFTLIFAIVCFVLSFMGCMAGGFKVNMH